MIDLVIVSDKMNDMTKQTIESFKTKHPFTVSVMGFKAHKGYNSALNAGIKKGKNPIIAACNNDLIFQDGSVDKLVDALNVLDSVSPWCPLTHHEYGWQQKPRGAVMGYQIGKVLPGWCIFLRRIAWERIGGFDERLKFWCCDNAYGEQLQQAKLSHALIPEAEVKHIQSQTIRTVTSEENQKLTTFELQKFRKLYPYAK